MKNFLVVLLSLIAVTSHAADKVINIVIGGRLVEIRLPVGKENLPPDKKMYLTYGNETIEINLGTAQQKFSPGKTTKQDEK